MSMPQTIPPMLAQAGELPGDDHAYGYEVKWDGVRAVVHLDAGRLGIAGRNGTDFTARYPELAELAEGQRARQLVLDGELVAFGADGRPSFERLQSRMHLGSDAAARRRSAEIPVTYVVFDLLWLDGHSTLTLPYHDRRRLLADLELTGRTWRTPAHRVGEGAALMRATEEQGLEGIVAKRLDSPYEPGRRSPAWIKVKHHRVQEFVVGGFTPGSGHRSRSLGALAVGIHEPGRGLRYAGKVGSGFTEATLASVLDALDGLRSPDNPFEGRPPPKDTVFVAPKLVVRVEFREWTASGTLRNPGFKGRVAGVDPESVVRET